MMRILVVDDDPSILLLLSQWLRKAGYIVLRADSADSALAAMKDGDVDLVLLDLEMPGKDGAECLGMIRSDPARRTIPAIMVTATPDRDTVVRLAKLHVNAIVIKDVQLQHNLLAKVAQILGVPPAASAPANKASTGQHTVPAIPHATPAAVRPAPAPTAESGPLPTLNEDEGPLPIQEAMQKLRELKPILSRTEFTDCVLVDSDDLKAMGPAARHVLSLTGSANASLDQVARAIRQDQALSLRVLKLANSALYNCSDRVDSIPKAVGRIGLSAIRTVVLSINVLDQFGDVPTVGHATIESFWEHSIACGLLASRIARTRGATPEHADSMFTAGLLHDIGRVLMASRLGSPYNDAIETADRLELPLEAVESRLLLMNHADVTDVLLRKWKFAAELIAPIAFHHLSVDNIRRTAPRLIDEVCTLALANRLAHALALGSSGNDVLYPLEEFLRQLRLSPAVIDDLISKTPDEVQDLRLNLLAHSPNPGRPAIDSLRDAAGDDLHPLNISIEPSFDAARILCRRLTDDGLPNVAVIRISSPKDREDLERRLKAAEKDRAPLPVLVIATSKACFFTPAMLRGRTIRQMLIPARITRILREMRAAAGLPDLSTAKPEREAAAAR